MSLDKNLSISIVIPCYNVEKYVEKTIRCIMNQTYKNLEVIVIDDKSTDNTYEILQKLHKEYEDKFKLLQNPENRGLSYTRNFGVKESTNDFIGFIDSDDYVDENYYEVLVSCLVDNKADLVVADIQLVNEKEEVIASVSKTCIGDITKENILNNSNCASACNKILRKDLLLKYPFLEGKINEDIAAIIPIIVNSEKISYTSDVKYYYVQRNYSIQNSKFSEKRFDIFDSIKICLERIQDSNEYDVIKENVLLQQLVILYIYIIINIEESSERKKYITIFGQKLKEYNYRIYDIERLKTFMKEHRRAVSYYCFLIKLLKFNAIGLINALIDFRNELKTNIYKLIGRNIETKKYTIESLEKLAKKQKALKENELKISVVLPNYNYEKFLIKRLYSILSQNVKLYEIIILDDKSSDNSRELIDIIYDSISKYVNIKKVYNEENSGSAFYQWQKGMELAKGDYVWIAEADDYCSKDILKYLQKPIISNKDKNILLSYSDTKFVDKKGNQIIKSVVPLIDLRKTGHWNKSYINNGKNEVENYSFLNCTIANVSSCIIKNGNYDKYFDYSLKFKQAGDWIFYVHLIKEGDIAYTNKILNYYRVHENNISTTMDKQKHLDEIKEIHSVIKEKFNISSDSWQQKEMNKRYEELINAWKL